MGLHVRATLLLPQPSLIVLRKMVELGYEADDIAIGREFKS